MEDEMIGSDADSMTQPRPKRDTRKRDRLPRGIFRHPCSTQKATIYAIRYTCGGGHIHQEKGGSIKSDALRIYHERRARAHDEPGWCPRAEHRQERARTAAAEAVERARVRFREYATDYLECSKTHKRGWKNDRTAIDSMLPVFGDRKLDEISTGDVERFRDGLLGRMSQATANRYRDALSGMYRRAIRLGIASVNPVKGVAKFKENGARLVYLTAEEEASIRDALAPDLRRHFAFSVNTGLRYSEQMNLRWCDVDMLTGTITIPRSKNGYVRRVPMNSAVRSMLVDLGGRRQRTDDPTEPVFSLRPDNSGRFFPKAVDRAQTALREAGRDASRLDGYVWHGNRHTFASRLVMAGVDLYTVQALGGWRSSAMVQRYAHLSPEHLHAAVERLVGKPTATVAGAVELRENFESAAAPPPGVS